MKQIPKKSFAAICIKAFNAEKDPATAWGFLELFKIYKFSYDKKNNLITTTPEIEFGSIPGTFGKDRKGFILAKRKKDQDYSSPYFWDHFVPIEE